MLRATTALGLLAATAPALALTQFGRQAGLQVSVDAASVRGLAQPVFGTVNAGQALGRLLASGLERDGARGLAHHERRRRIDETGLAKECRQCSGGIRPDRGKAVHDLDQQEQQTQGPGSACRPSGQPLGTARSRSAGGMER